MRERFAQYSHQALFHDLPGVYQMGDVYARSVIVIGTSDGSLIRKYFASYAVQRGVGISMTRP